MNFKEQINDSFFSYSMRYILIMIVISTVLIILVYSFDIIDITNKWSAVIAGLISNFITIFFITFFLDNYLKIIDMKYKNERLLERRQFDIKYGDKIRNFIKKNPDLREDEFIKALKEFSKNLDKDL